MGVFVYSFPWVVTHGYIHGSLSDKNGGTRAAVFVFGVT